MKNKFEQKKENTYRNCSQQGDLLSLEKKQKPLQNLGLNYTKGLKFKPLPLSGQPVE